MRGAGPPEWLRGTRDEGGGGYVNVVGDGAMGRGGEIDKGMGWGAEAGMGG